MGKNWHPFCGDSGLKIFIWFRLQTENRSGSLSAGKKSGRNFSCRFLMWLEIAWEAECSLIKRQTSQSCTKGKHADVLPLSSDRLKKTFLVFGSDSLHYAGGLPLYKEAIRSIHPLCSPRRTPTCLLMLRHWEMTTACHFWYVPIILDT